MNVNYHDNTGFERDTVSYNDTYRSRDDEDEMDRENMARKEGTTLSGRGHDVADYVMYKRRWFGMLAIFMLNLSTGLVWLTFNAVPDISAEWLHTGKSHVNLSVSVTLIIYEFF